MQTERFFDDLPTLETERLILRKMRMDDMQDLFEYASDPQVARMGMWQAFQTMEDSREDLTEILEGYEKKTLVSWGIEHKADRKLIGRCSYEKWGRMSNRAEIGYALARPYWNKGYMTEAVRAVMDFGFRVMRLHRVEAVCLDDNIGSERVLQKMGMQLEGFLREATKIEGQYRNLKMYAILENEWKK